ncbi:MAG: hypothetical protein C0615_10575 [Desulfuromonas sp.]|nr:MAG: hypothetical protein C0615_10575 [Desulfuromonas sp.]
MKRYRITLLAICLVLLWLGYHDLKLHFDNPEPLAISIEELAANGAPRDWLQIEGGTLDLEQAINPTGRVETFESGPFFVPLRSSDSGQQIKVVIETRRPEVIATLKHYVLDFNTEAEQNRYLEENKALFHPQNEITGTTASWLTSNANRDKLLQLAKEQNMPVSDDVVFISEGKEPARYRGFFFTGIALLGLLKFIQMVIRRESGLAIDMPDEDEK